ncbi:hypothetical protein CJ193_005530 [Pseudoglutamicibacter albus]|uniref:hypothetical protein n=1 Tax=Pseudoglutamicibacter albus TaxID=98671 RepID=UPI000C75796E|nr:hypothetical protein [Pseudoglutamicibacter albus]PKY80079.1 hypothetical protein CYJ35_06670 [Pseudoglutamicibacter albus]WIK83560.1 hypothetical protein CJ193_005530 [Pseudoglutamicibacter albus]
MFSKTKTARRTLATMAVAPLLAVSLVGCGDKNGGGEPSPEPSQSSQPMQTETAQPSPSMSSQGQQSQGTQGSQTTGAANADPKFLEFMKNNVSSDYQVLDLGPHLKKSDVGAGNLANTCPAVIYGAADLAKDGAQVVSASQAEPKQKAVTVLMYPSADKANAALEQVKQEIANPECETVPVNGNNISIKPVTNSYGFDNPAGFTMNISGNKIENLFAAKGQFLVLVIGDLNEVASDGKKVYDALPTS